MGTLLSRVIYLLSPWYAENLNLTKKDEIITLALHTSPDYEASFSSVLYKDSVAQIVFDTLIKNQEYMSFNGQYDKSNTKLKEILDYTMKLQGDAFATTETLQKKLNELGNIPLKHSVYYTEKQSNEISKKENV